MLSLLRQSYFRKNFLYILALNKKSQAPSLGFFYLRRLRSEKCFRYSFGVTPTHFEHLRNYRVGTFFEQFSLQEEENTQRKMPTNFRVAFLLVECLTTQRLHFLCRAKLSGVHLLQILTSRRSKPSSKSECDVPGTDLHHAAHSHCKSRSHRPSPRIHDFR